MDYSQLVDLSPDGIFLSRNNAIFFLNPAALRLFGGIFGVLITIVLVLLVVHILVPGMHVPTAL